MKHLHFYVASICDYFEWAFYLNPLLIKYDLTKRFRVHYQEATTSKANVLTSWSHSQQIPLNSVSALQLVDQVRLFLTIDKRLRLTTIANYCTQLNLSWSANLCFHWLPLLSTARKAKWPNDNSVSLLSQKQKTCWTLSCLTLSLDKEEAIPAETRLT